MKTSLAVIVLLAAGPCVSYADDQNASLVQMFSSLCSGDSLDFKGIEAKAQAMKLEVHHEKSPDDGVTGYYKSWIVPGKENVEELSAIQAAGKKGLVTSCGLTALDVDGKDFRDELTKALRLGDPREDSVSQDGVRRLARWDYGPEGGGMQLMMVDASPKGKPGVNLTIIQADAARIPPGQAAPEEAPSATTPAAPQDTGPAAPAQQ